MSTLGPVSVVVPVLAPGPALAALLRQLAPAGPGEVLLVDGGSAVPPTSGPGPGVRVLAAPRGRGTQCAVGAEAAQGEWLLFLHADTRLGAGWEAAVRAALADPARAYHFRFALDDPSPQARRLERAVAWRCRVLALPYGDQGLLIHRGLYRAVGGFAPLPLMEDVDIIRRLGRKRIAALDAAAVTSAARWRREGWWGRSARNLLVLGLWFLGVPPRHLLRLYGRAPPPGEAPGNSPPAG